MESGIASQGMLTSFTQFIGYGLGMGAVLVAVTVGAPMSRGVVAQWLPRAIPYFHRISALYLMGAGTYLICYWVFYAGFFF